VNGTAEERVLELFDVATGAVQLSTRVAPGSLLVDAVGENAVIAPNSHAPSREVLVVAPSGERTALASPSPAVFVAATPTHSVWIAPGGPTTLSGERLLVVDQDGTATTIPAPQGQSWLPVSGATIPSNSPPFPTTTSDGRRVLLGLTSTDDVNKTTHRHVILDVERASTTVVYEGEGSAFWARDDRTVIVIHRVGSHEAVTAIDTATDQTTLVDDAVPDGFYVIAAR
jgi:hypothetical protein